MLGQGASRYYIVPASGLEIPCSTFTLPRDDDSREDVFGKNRGKGHCDFWTALHLFADFVQCSGDGMINPLEGLSNAFYVEEMESRFNTRVELLDNHIHASI